MSDIITTITPNPAINVEIIGTGPKGDKGDTPVKGVDYYTEDDKQELLQELLERSYYVHNQITSVEIWTINHNLNKFPSITIVDSSGNLVMGDVSYESLNTVKIYFNSAFSGKAFLN